MWLRGARRRRRRARHLVTDSETTEEIRSRIRQLFTNGRRVFLAHEIPSPSVLFQIDCWGIASRSIFEGPWPSARGHCAKNPDRFRFLYLTDIRRFRYPFLEILPDSRQLRFLRFNIYEIYTKALKILTILLSSKKVEGTLELRATEIVKKLNNIWKRTCDRRDLFTLIFYCN